MHTGLLRIFVAESAVGAITGAARVIGAGLPVALFRRFGLAAIAVETTVAGAFAGGFITVALSVTLAMCR